jgi:hypothetical protein
MSWLAAASVALMSIAAVAQERGVVLGQGEEFTVEIDVFSGRPNPVLVLKDPAEVRAFTQKVQEACTQASAVAPAAAPEYPGILGYRGLSVSRSLKGEAAPSFVVTRGSMKMAKQQAPLACQPRMNALAADASGDVHLLGAGTGLEAFVAQLALQKGAINESVYQAIIKELSGK